MFNNMFDNLNATAITGLTKELNLLYVYNYYLKNNRNILIIANSMFEASSIYEGLLNYTNDVLFFPMDDFITSEAVSISPEFMVERINSLNQLVFNDERYIVVTCLMGLLRYLPSKELWKKCVINLSVGNSYKRDDFIRKLFDLGYDNQSLVSKTGEMAVRGYVVDIFPIGLDSPIRIEFWGDTIESIRMFDVDSQLSKQEIKNVAIYPFSEFILNEFNDDIVRKQKYLKKYSDKISNISEYLGDYSTFYYDYNQIKASYIRLQEEILDYRESSFEDISVEYMNKLEDIFVKDEHYIYDFDNYVDDFNAKVSVFSSSSIVNYNGNILDLSNDLLKYIDSKKTVILCFNNKNTLNKVYNELDAIKGVITTEDNIVLGMVNFIVKRINCGYIFNDFVVISENDLFSLMPSTNKYKNSFKLGTKIKSIKSLSIGDYVVHDINGVAIYNGIITLSKNGLKKDYIKLQFYGNDVLYVPVEKIDRISKYSSKEGVVPKINKLGSGDFQKTKLRLKKKLQDIAAKLLNIYALRESKEGYAFSCDDENQTLFESEFEFKETTDQLLAIRKIKDEMEKKTPMDMLLCGDVGYGKTEVAFRAIFKAVNDGKQVAYLCPTTILSNQQYKSALKRFRNFPINIALLNRFVTPKEQKIIVDKLKNNKIDILFGTHRILSDDIKFNNLGLLVIDEEQRFGVVHKEKIKEYKANVDVLTLSATPIPRTLQMSLSGIRSLSLIETPPVDRLPVQTYVLPFNKSVVRDAIYKELSRKGQVFILYNKIDSIELEVSRIKELVPEARIDYAHGRMNKTLLEDKMQDFVDYKCDVLVCTTIIETGIDIPNANTLIIIDADHFGLSQLYQIRGRIGRSNKIGYAYLMYDNRRELNDIAVKRLQTIKEFTELGSGFKIAMRDLSIRGAGDILGDEQSGFIDTVGIDLYLKMLNDAVLELNGEKKDNDEENNLVDNKPLIEVATHIEDEYSASDDIKIEIHKKINDVDSYEKLLSVKRELEDRFGKVSLDMETYMYEEWFEKLAKKLNIKDVKQTKNSIEITLPKDISQVIDGEELFIQAYEISKMFRFSYRLGRIVIILDTVKINDNYLIYINDLLTKIIEFMDKKNSDTSL